MIAGSVPRGETETLFCIPHLVRTNPADDQASTSIFDRGKENGSPPLFDKAVESNGLHGQKDPRPIKISFSNSDRTTRGGKQHGIRNDTRTARISGQV